MFTLFMTAVPFAVVVGFVIVAWVLLDGVAETVRKPSELELRLVATRLGYEGVDGLYRGRRVELFAEAGGKAGARICGGPKFLTARSRRHVPRRRLFAEDEGWFGAVGPRSRIIEASGPASIRAPMISVPSGLRTDQSARAVSSQREEARFSERP